MRRLLPLFLCLASAVAAPSPDDASRRAALGKLTTEARVAKLLELSSEDVQKHRYPQALQRADEALRLDPGNAVALNTRGAALTELKRFDEASKTLDAAVAAAPDAFAPRFNQGEVLSLQKKYPEAAEHFSNLQTVFGASPLLKYKLYVCYTLAGNKDRAAEFLDQMRYPIDGPAWYFAHAVELLQAGKTAEARRLIDVAEAIHGDDAIAYHDTLVESGLLK